MAEDILKEYRQLKGIIRTSVGQCCSCLVPHRFVRIQFWGIGRQWFEPDPFVATQERAHEIPFVTAPVVEDYNDETPQMAKQVTVKRGYLDVVEVGVRQTAEEEACASALGTD